MQIHQQTQRSLILRHDSENIKNYYISIWLSVAITFDFVDLPNFERT
ncbi:hypothetical protein [Fischerella sp. JS2]|nr:hypothetical protein [Fischerella sp. JS2]